MAIAAVPLGIVRAALDVLRDLSEGKTPRSGSTQLREKPATQPAMGRAEALLRAACEFLLEGRDEAGRAASTSEPLTLEQRALLRLTCARAADATKAAVQIVYNAGGATVDYESSPLQQCFRGVHAAAQHFQIHRAQQGSNSPSALALGAARAYYPIVDR
jgi:alkylation response protein AidB-like acyl-CoA dehydrogenase